MSITGGAVVTPAIVNGRQLLAQVTNDAGGVASDLTLNIADVPSLTGDIVVDASTLAYNLSDSSWTGDQRLMSNWSSPISAMAMRRRPALTTSSSVWAKCPAAGGRSTS